MAAARLPGAAAAAASASGSRARARARVGTLADIDDGAIVTIPLAPETPADYLKRKKYIKSLGQGYLDQREKLVKETTRTLKYYGMSDSWIQQLFQAEVDDKGVFTDTLLLHLLRSMAVGDAEAPAAEGAPAAGRSFYGQIMNSPLPTTVDQLRSATPGAGEEGFERAFNYLFYHLNHLRKTYNQANKNSHVLDALYCLLVLKYEALKRQGNGEDPLVYYTASEAQPYTLPSWLSDASQLISAQIFGVIYWCMAVGPASSQTGSAGAGAAIAVVSDGANVIQIQRVSPLGLPFWRGVRERTLGLHHMYLKAFRYNKVGAAVATGLTVSTYSGLSVLGGVPIAATCQESVTKYFGAKSAKGLGYFSWAMRTALILNALLVVPQELMNETALAAMDFRRRSVIAALTRFVLKVVLSITLAALYTVGQVPKVPGYVVGVFPALGERYPSIADKDSSLSWGIQSTAFIPLMALNIYYILLGIGALIFLYEAMRFLCKARGNQERKDFCYNNAIGILAAGMALLCVTGEPGVSITSAEGWFDTMVGLLAAVFSNWGAFENNASVAAHVGSRVLSYQLTNTTVELAHLEREGASGATAPRGTAVAISSDGGATAAINTSQPGRATVALRGEIELISMPARDRRAARDALVALEASTARHQEFHAVLRVATTKLGTRVGKFADNNVVWKVLQLYLLRVFTMGCATRPAGQSMGDWANTFFCCGRRSAGRYSNVDAGDGARMSLLSAAPAPSPAGTLV